MVRLQVLALGVETFENLAVVSLAITTMQVAFPERLLALTSAVATITVAFLERLVAVTLAVATTSIVMLEESPVRLATGSLDKAAILGLILVWVDSVANKDNAAAAEMLVDTVEGSYLVVEAINQQLLVLVKIMVS